MKQAIQIYPRLIMQLRKSKTDSPYRLLLVARFIDRSGVGIVDIESLKNQCEPIQKAQQFEKTLKKFDGILWTIGNSRLYLFSDEKIARLFNVRSVGVRSTRINLSTILDTKLGEYRALMFGLYVNLYGHEKLVSRRTIERWAGIPASTQRSYIATCRNVGLIIDSKTNWEPVQNTETNCLETVVGMRYHHTLERGYTPAIIQDKKGLYAKKGNYYLAFQLPNSYTFSNVESKASIRASHINKNLNKTSVSPSGNPVEEYLQRKAKRSMWKAYAKERGGKLAPIENKHFIQQCEFLLHGGVKFEAGRPQC